MASLTPGYSFGSTEQVTNAKLATLVSGGTVSSIVDADISAGASITLSKINITAASINYDRLNLGGNVVNADINASAAIDNSKLNLATITQNVDFTGNMEVGTVNQGDILYDNGTTLTRLTPGTSGQFLQTNGTSANPQWTTLASIPRVLIGTWQDNTGVEAPGSGTYSNSVIIDSGTDWAGKNVLVIGTTEIQGTDSFSSTYPNITNSSATALSGIPYSSGLISFGLRVLQLPSNNYVTVGTVPTNGGYIGIGTNSSGELCMFNIYHSTGAPGISYCQFSGAIIRTP